MSFSLFRCFWVLILLSILNVLGSSVHFFFSRFVKFIACSADRCPVNSIIMFSSYSLWCSRSFFLSLRRYLTLSTF